MLVAAGLALVLDFVIIRLVADDEWSMAYTRLIGWASFAMLGLFAVLKGVLYLCTQ